MVKSKTQELDNIFHSLSDPTRRSILRDLGKGEKTVGEIARPYRMSLAAISKHLKVLEMARLIARRKEGSHQFVRLNPETLKAADEWLSYYEQFWNDRLEALRNLLEEEGEKNE
ncbi:MAG: ArsR/SmtB family transcription factor [Leptospirales bacterium]